MEFIRFAITDRGIFTNNPTGNPLRGRSLKQMLKTVGTTYKLTYKIEGKMVTFDDISQEETDSLYEFCKTLHTPYMPDFQLYEIIRAEIKGFFDGARSLEDTVNIYLKE